MSGVFFQFSPEGLTFVATDAHKLVKYARTDVTSLRLLFYYAKEAFDYFKKYPFCFRC
jgi:hypothetical protein